MRYVWNGWRCIEERVSATSDEKFIPTPRGVYVHGNNIDEVLQVRHTGRSGDRELTVEDVEDGEVTLAGAGWGEDMLIGMHIAIWDDNTTARVYEIAGNDETDGNNNTLIRLADNEGLGEYTTNARAEIFFLPQYDMIYTYHSDAQGNIVAISGESGTVLERYEYDVYGRLTDAWIWNDSGYFEAVMNFGGFVSMSAYYTASSIDNEIFF